MSHPFIDELEVLLVFEDLEQFHGMPPTGVKATHLSPITSCMDLVYLVRRHSHGVSQSHGCSSLVAAVAPASYVARPAHTVDTVSLQHGPVEARKNLLLQTPIWQTDWPCGLWAAMQVVSPFSGPAWIGSCFCVAWLHPSEVTSGSGGAAIASDLTPLAAASALSLAWGWLLKV